MRNEYDFSKGKRGAVIPSPGKTRITIMLDDEIVESFRARAESAGTGYQALINAALRDSIAKPKGRLLTEAMVKRALRDALEDIGMSNAMDEGLKTKRVSRSKVMKALGR